MRSITSKEPYVFKVVDRIITISEYIAFASLWMITLLILYDVFVRYVFGGTSDWSLDVVQLTQVTLAFAVAAPVLRSGGHISMEVLPSLVSASIKRWLEVASNAICAAGCLWMVAVTWKAFMRSYQISESAFGIALPLYPWKLLAPICFVLLSLQFFRFFAMNLRAKPYFFI